MKVDGPRKHTKVKKHKSGPKKKKSRKDCERFDRKIGSFISTESEEISVTIDLNKVKFFL